MASSLIILAALSEDPVLMTRTHVVLTTANSSFRASSTLCPPPVPDIQAIPGKTPIHIKKFLFNLTYHLLIILVM